MMETGPSTARSSRLPFVLVCAAAFSIFGLTASHAIDWWDSSRYSLAAVTLGVAPAPGSLILTLMGWAVTRPVMGLHAAYILNLLAAALATTTSVLVLLSARRLLALTASTGSPGTGSARHPTAMFVAALGALTFAYSSAFWEYATEFTPYVLTTVVTGLILWSMLRWWEVADSPGAWRWLGFLALLIGLDFSVHRTNVLLLPAIVIWILFRRPRTFTSVRTWLGGVAGLLVGLAFQLLIIPIAARQPSFNTGDPSNWSRFYDYVTMAQMGGAPKIWPRNAPFWSVQVMDVVHAFGASFAWHTGWLAAFGVLPALFGILGYGFLWRRNRRLAMAMGALLLCHAAATIIYFNIPEHYFRSLHRHYLPLLVTFGILVAYGMGESLRRITFVTRPGGWSTQWVTAGVMAIVPVAQGLHNWPLRNSSGRSFAEDYAANLLNGLPPNAILLAVGDNDTYPLWYMQQAVNLRPDVDVINLPQTWASWYVEQILRSDPTFPIRRLPPGSMNMPPQWNATIPVSGAPIDYALPTDAALPDSLRLHSISSTGSDGTRIYDALLLTLLSANRWQRPICIATSAGETSFTWLRPYLRPDGLFWRMVPYRDPPLNTGILETNLLEGYRYQGYAQAMVPLDDQSRFMGALYYQAFIALGKAEYARGNVGQCKSAHESALSDLPFGRMKPDSALVKRLTEMCGGP